MEYKFEKTPKGDVKVKEEFTPARRYSFLVGKNESSHTAQSCFIDILINDIHNLKLNEIEKAFNIEKVTKEFYEKYRDLFLQIKKSLDEIIEKDEEIRQEFQDKGVNVIDFSKKLLGQIVFLYFLQKKGWFGVKEGQNWGTGPKNFLRELFEKKHCDYENFFNNILEPLFYEALRNDRSHDDHYFSYFKCKIPFLNGGLFDPLNDYNWAKTDILLPDTLFSNQVKTKEGDIGKGILDILDRYNFTVKEDEPLEKEVAVDPEMLGKVFENLLEVKDRKSKGTYYTPREIVHYMCQQSLINYLYTECHNPSPFTGEGKGEGVIASEAKQSLPTKEDIEKLIKYGDTTIENDDYVVSKGEETKTYSFKLPENIRKNAKRIDEALKNIRVCDPAIGSGAFLVGMMNEIIRARNALTPYLSLQEAEATKQSRTIYNFKRHAIQNCLYGVDIDPGAVEIAKLRLWLSLIVDEEDINKIKPLPNLDYKIMQGNSLISEFMGIDLDNEKQNNENARLFSTDESKEFYEVLKDKKNELLNQPNTNKKKALRKEIEDLIINIFELKLEKQKSDYFKKFKEIEERYERHPIKEEREKEIKREMDALSRRTGFNLGEFEEQLRQYTSNRKIRPFFPWKLYFSEIFQEKDGFDVVIANPPYVKEYTNRKAFDGVRESLYYQGKMDIWYLFACEGIDLLKNNSGVLTFIAQNNWVTSYGASKLRDKVIKEVIILQLLDFGDYKIFENAGIQTMIMMFKKDKSDNYNFDYRKLFQKNASLQDVFGLLNQEPNPKLEYLTPLIQKGKYLNKPLTFSNSVIEDILDKISKQSNFKLYESEIAQGIVCPQDHVIKNTQKILDYQFKIGEGIFILSSEEKNNIFFSKKESELIKPYYTTNQLSKYYANKNNVEWVIYTDSRFKYPENIKTYPNIKKHLDKFKKVITSNNKPYGLHRARDENFFKGEKIIAVRKCIEPTFTYTNFDCYVSAAFYVIKTTRIDLKYLTALLNSKLIAFWLKQRGKMQGNNYQIDKEPLLALPIIKPGEDEQKEIITLVNQILTSKNRNPDADINHCEREIDRLIYGLYGLMAEKIRIVEGGI